MNFSFNKDIANDILLDKVTKNMRDWCEKELGMPKMSM